MHAQSKNFYSDSEAAARNKTLQSRLRILTGFVVKRDEAFASLPDGEDLRDQARNIKAHSIANLDRLLLQLEKNVNAAGGRVHWAVDGDQACAIVLDLARAHGVNRVVKSKSMVTEEIELNEALERVGIEAIETDLGEYIVQLAQEKPSHIIAPAVHKSRVDIAELFADRIGGNGSSDPGELTLLARRRLREKFLSAGMGITGANFAIAESGTIVLVENEGNIRLTTSLPRIHVAIVGIEKVIPRLTDLAVFLKILARSASGQKMSSYVSLITGPRRTSEADGADEFHLILLDNGRTKMLADPEMREALYCLRCGACLNVCPVYQRIGGHAYGTVYPGPIGSVVTPELAGLAVAKDLPFASSLCGACREVCPVRINIPHMLLALRRNWSQQSSSRLERAAMTLWSMTMRHPLLYRMAFKVASIIGGPMSEEGWIKQMPLVFSGWTSNRDFPRIAPRSFRSRWRDLKESRR